MDLEFARIRPVAPLDSASHPGQPAGMNAQTTFEIGWMITLMAEFKVESLSIAGTRVAVKP
jgi:hypothetical protein